ncbi:copper resistance D family protein [Aestuariibacter salexigens]|uniref:copper resistance D family protein n=1 Tax=Aestuariibacter salexigens TaxID=226010 RepID=UPI00041D7B11|nr:CopD family protein [Aestuariibacter salexigens]
METAIWNSAIVISKLFFYFGFVLAAGYAFFAFSKPWANQSAVKPDIPKLTITLVAIALLANAVWFFATTGLMAEAGLQGAFDSFIVNMMWSAAIGDIALFRAVGLTMVLLAVMLASVVTLSRLLRGGIQLILVVAALFLAYSFIQLGHVSELGFTNQLLLLFHVLVMAWWFGSLYPLKRACDALEDEQLILMMESFGKQASVMVVLSVVAGVLLAIELIGSVNALFTTSYGLTLLVKLGLVVSILGIAARNKLRLVPAIQSGEGRALLSQSIANEMIVAVLILSVTAALTTVVGPEF